MDVTVTYINLIQLLFDITPRIDTVTRKVYFSFTISNRQSAYLHLYSSCRLNSNHAASYIDLASLVIEFVSERDLTSPTTIKALSLTNCVVNLCIASNLVFFTFDQ